MPQNFEAQKNEEDRTLAQQVHQQLLTHWHELAGLAWVSFESYGRGAVLVDFRAYARLPRRPKVTAYVQDAGIADEPSLAPLRELVAAYNPAEDVVFLIFTPAGNTILDLVQTPAGALPPPEAAEVKG